MLHNVNNYVASFKTALDKMDLPEHRIVIRPDKAPTMEHPRRFNAPLTDEVAVLIVGQQFNNSDIVLQKRNDQLQRVAETHRSYHALQYPLLFCRGEDKKIKNELMRGQSAKRGVCRFLSKQARRAKFEFIQHIRDLATKIACDVSTNLSLHCSILPVRRTGHGS